MGKEKTWVHLPTRSTHPMKVILKKFPASITDFLMQHTSTGLLKFKSTSHSASL